MACNVLVMNELYKKVLLSAYCVSEGSIFFLFLGRDFFSFFSHTSWNFFA